MSPASALAVSTGEQIFHPQLCRGFGCCPAEMGGGAQSSSETRELGNSFYEVLQGTTISQIDSVVLP